MGRPILSMTSVWATLPPKMPEKDSAAVFSTPAAPALTASTAVMQAATRMVLPMGRRTRRVCRAAALAAFDASWRFCSPVKCRPSMADLYSN